MNNLKIISGGQTGIDLMSLQEAKLLGFPTGGMAPKYYKTENGYDYTLKEEYGLVESESDNYRVRTQVNIDCSGGTILFGDMESIGSKLTIQFCKLLHKPYVINPIAHEIMEFIIKNNIRVLNVAGNRASKLGNRLEHYRKIFRQGLEFYLNANKEDIQEEKREV